MPSLALSLTLLLCAASALAQGAATKTHAPQADNASRKICRSAAIPGSRIRGKPICLTADEWRDLSLSSQRQRQDLSNEESKVTMGAIPSG
ncbi:MAG TPA: hypothetical protein VLM36_11245 [Sphingomicrobium sp.]|nr:hypothetical protein [Sphingomicrobium sp.]